MPTWPTGYLGRSGQLTHEPVYALFLFSDWTRFFGDHTAADTTIAHSGTKSLAIEAADREAVEADLMFWDNDGVELVKWVSSAGGATVFTVQRGQYGTTARALNDGSSIGVIMGTFTTGTIPGLTLNYKNGWASFPSGGAVEFDRQTGRTTYTDLTMEVQDRGGAVTRLLQTSPLIGERAVLMVGYAGLDFGSWAQMYTGTVTNVAIRRGGVYEFTIQTAEKKLAQKLFQHVEDATGTTNGLTIGATVDAFETEEGMPQEISSHQTGTDSTAALNAVYAGYHLKFGDEIVRIDDRDGGTHVLTITRGALGTTAEAHSADTPATLLFAIEGNPINILLGFLLSRDRDHAGDAADGAYKYTWRFVHDSTTENWIGLGFHEADLNIASFEAIRDDWFRDDTHRVIIDRAENMKTFIEDGLLRDKNLNLYTDRSGRIALAIDKPPIGADVETLTEDDIIGVPDLEFDNTEIVNRVTFRYDKQDVGTDYDGTSIRLDAASQLDYDTDQELEVKSRGTHSDFNGESRSVTYAHAKLRAFKDPNPGMVLPVLFNKIRIEPGTTVDVTHGGIPDIRNGVRGLTNKRMQVVGKRPDWRRGALELTVIDSAYYQRYGLIAPSAAVRYDIASADAQSIYCFISDTTTEAMSNGDRGYRIA